MVELCLGTFFTKGDPFQFHEVGILDLEHMKCVCMLGIECISNLPFFNPVHRHASVSRQETESFKTTLWAPGVYKDCHCDFMAGVLLGLDSSTRNHSAGDRWL